LGLKQNHLSYNSRYGKGGTPNLSLNGSSIRIQPSVFLLDDLLLEIGGEGRIMPWQNKKQYNIPRLLFETKLTKFHNNFIWGGHIQFVPRFPYREIEDNIIQKIWNFSIQAFLGYNI
jgi:hypothetical protein